MNKLHIWCALFLLAAAYPQDRPAIDAINKIPFETKIKDAALLDEVFLKNASDASKIKYALGEAESYANLGLVYYYQGKYERNITFSLKAIKIYESIGNVEKQASQYAELGYSMKRRNMEKALYYMQKGKSIGESHQLQSTLADIYNNYGVLKEMQYELDSALWFYEKGLAIKQRRNDLHGIPYSLNNIAGVYVLEKKYDEAKKIFDSVVDMRKQLNDAVGLAENYQLYGDLYTAQKNWKMALEYYSMSLEKSLKYKYTYLVSSNYQSISNCYEALHDNEKALSNFKKYTQFKDSLLNKETNSKIAELEIRFDTNKKEKQLAQNKNLLQRKESEARQKNIILAAISVLALSIACIGFLIFRQQKLKNTQLAQEHELKTAISHIETQNKLQEQRLNISRDLHDNIGAQLTFIISAVDNIKYAFDIQNSRLDSKLQSISNFTKSTIVELRDTIWAMNSDEISFEDLRARIMNFIEKAKQAKENVAFSFTIDELVQRLSLSSIVGMNIYRTIQEAVNNAIKYSESTSIDITVAHIQNEIGITIKDNGAGFDKVAIERGNGLGNMQKRIEDIGGIFNLESGQGIGTTITLLLKLNQNADL